MACVLFACSLNAQSIESAEALWHAGRYQDANEAFRAVVGANPRNAGYRVRWGRFYLERFQPVDATALFKEALGIDPKNAGAMLGLALVAAENFEQGAVKMAEAALEMDPKLLEARELLARLALEDGDEKRTIEQVDRAVAMSPDALQAMSVRAAMELLDGRDAQPWIGRVLARDAHYGRLYETIGRFFVLNRRYEEGIAAYRKAIALEPGLWSAHSQLGVNLMRLGQDAEARTELEQCYHHGYQDAATRNTLRLLDSYKNFVTVTSPRTVLKFDRKEAALLAPYFQEELRRAMAAYDKKYGFTLRQPVRVEVYPNHEDFAVRTLGLPGLGALGVTFGYAVAMDSPSARKPGSFHWASTLWHELSHVYVLEATQHRVPRWFTEGMAVYEETAASPEWGDRMDPDVVEAIRDKKLLPVAQLDRGFVRPSYPTQVLVSYFQAGRICEFINGQWGYGKLLEMMRDFGTGAGTPEVIERRLGMKPEEFDRRFLAALDQETRKTVAGLGEWRTKMKAAQELRRQGRYDEAIREARTARDLYPEYVEPGSAYELLADAYEAKGDKAAAMPELERYAKMGGRNPAALKLLATLLEAAGRPREAAATLDRLNYIAPMDEDVHRRLGDLWMAEGRTDDAIREYRAVVAREPLDPAAAHFALARALRAGGRAAEAKDELLAALEAAPGYRPAQKMLLEISK